MRTWPLVLLASALAVPPALGESPNWFERLVPQGTLAAFQHGTYPSLGDNTHAGADIAAACGASVHAWADGTVVDAVTETWDQNFQTLGYMLIIRHEASAGRPVVYSAYLHLQGPPDAGVGESVAASEPIGRIGETGAAHGCHLHFELRHFSSRFHPLWANIYGRGDKRQSDEFLRDWSDPAAWPVNSMLPLQLLCPEATSRGGEVVPPCPFPDPDRCPGEGCQYGRWTATSTTFLYDAVASDDVIAEIAPGETVVALGGIVYTIPCKSRVIYPMAGLQMGDILYRITYIGEGSFEYWSSGRFVDGWGNDCYVSSRASSSCWIEPLATCVRDSEWWANVQTSSGSIGWTRETDKFLGTSVHNMP